LINNSARLFAARKIERDNKLEPDIPAHIIDPLALLSNCSDSASVVRQKILIVAQMIYVGNIEQVGTTDRETANDMLVYRVHKIHPDSRVK
jgi:hypothetical protein